MAEMLSKEQSAPWLPCDWGDCDGSTVGYRNDIEGHGWLPVCQRHYDQEPDKELVAKFVTEAHCRALEAEVDRLKEENERLTGAAVKAIDDVNDYYASR